jgi:tetratricopeptide (TPR) repeat protein
MTIDINASAGAYAPAPMTAVQTFRGDGAVGVNSIYSKLSSAQLDQALRGYWRDKYDYVDIKSVNWAFDGASGEGKLSMSGTANIRWNDGWFYVPGSTVAYKPDFTRAEGPFHDAPFAMSFPDWDATHVQVKLPDSFIASHQQLPQPVNEKLAGSQYERTAKLAGSVLSVTTSERSLQSELPYKDALAAQSRLRTLYDDDVYLRIPDEYQPNKADLAGLVSRQPGSADDFIRRGNIYLDSGKLDEAIADFTEAHRLDPDNKWAMADRGIAHVWKREFDEAAADFAAADSVDPDNPALIRGHALMAELKGDFDAAVTGYSRSLEKDPDNLFAKAHRASALIDLGKPNEALKDLDAMLKTDPSNTAALTARATAYRSLGENDKALADADAVVKQGKVPPQLRLLRANIFRSQGKSDLVVHEAELLVKENPDSDYALVAAGKIFSAAGQRDKAIAAIDRALTVHPYAYIYLNRSLVRSPKDYAARLADIDEALKLEPGNAEALGMKASLLRIRKNYSEAIAAYDAALAGSDGNDLDLRRGRAVALYETGKTVDAEKAFGDIRSRSKSATDLNNLCWDKATAGILLESAVQDCRDALKLRPDTSGYNDSLGLALLRLGKLDDALKTYTAAIDKSHIAGSYLGRALVYARKGDMTRAKADRAEALKRNPDIEAEFAEYGLAFPNPSGEAAK